MATSIQTSTWNNATDADFRAWGKAVSDGIAAVGLVKVPDAGTANWTTATKPGTNLTASAWEVWRFDDALQSTAPVFIKVEYGCSELAAPQMWVTIGRGTDGAGAITGVLAPRRAARVDTLAAASSSSTIEPIHISSDGSSLCVVPRLSGGADIHSPAFIIDRSRDHTGTPTAAGGVILTEGAGALSPGTGSQGVPAQMHAWTYTGDYTMGDAPAVAPANVNSSSANSAMTSLTSGDRAPVFPYVVTVPNHDPWQVLAAVAVMAGDAPNGPFTANVLGTIREYRSIVVGTGHSRWMTGQAVNGYTGLCILWEA